MGQAGLVWPGPVSERSAGVETLGWDKGYLTRVGNECLTRPAGGPPLAMLISRSSCVFVHDIWRS